MLREQIIGGIDELLRKADFNTVHTGGCFDIIAHRDFSLLLKIVLNIDSIEENQANNLKVVSDFFQSFPLLIGLRTRKNFIEADVVYERFELPAVSPQTFENMLYGEYPVIQARSGGCFVEIDSDTLRRRREELGLSLGNLASKVGVSRKSLRYYEHGGKSLAGTAAKLERVLETRLTKPVGFKKYEAKNVVQNECGLVGYVSKKLRAIGFEAAITKKTPFDIVAKQENRKMFFAGVSRKRCDVVRRAEIIRDVSGVMNRQAVFVLEKSREENILDIPVVSRRELGKVSDAEEFFELLEKRA